MFSILKGITKPFVGSSSPQTGSGSQTERPGDRLEDGFLLVGQSTSERTTVTARDFQHQNVDSPPGYTDVMNNDGLPNYSAYSSSLNQYTPTLNVSQHPGIQYGNPSQPGSSSTNSGAVHSSTGDSSAKSAQCQRSSNQTAISDIPFTLGPSVNTCLILSDLQNSNILYQRTFDASIYDYDFNLELNFLHGSYDNCMEVSD